jgi:hypothetical protein
MPWLPIKILPGNAYSCEYTVEYRNGIGVLVVSELALSNGRSPVQGVTRFQMAKA